MTKARGASGLPGHNVKDRNGSEFYRNPGESATSDREQAERFLTLLDETADAFTFQTFDDNPDPEKKNRALAKILHGTLEQRWRELAALNGRGAGIYVMVNAGDLCGRRNENVTRIRALFSDQDTPGRGIPQDLPEPHITVESSPGKVHAYWLCDEIELAEFSDLQARVAQRCQSDLCVKDLARVLRLPGFYHRKGEPYLVRIVQESGAQAYPKAKLLEAFSPIKNGREYTQVEPQDDNGRRLDDETYRDLRSALDALDPDDYQAWIDAGIALKSAGKQGFMLWCEWSKGSPKYDPAVQREKWATFKPERTGYEAIFAKAQRTGWVNPKRKGNGPAPEEGKTDWADPEPFPDGLPPVDPLEPAMIPDPLRAWIFDAADRLQCPAEFIAAPAIIALGAIIGRRVAVLPKKHDDWPVVPNLWGATVGTPSTSKTPARDEGLRHLSRLVAVEIAAHQDAMKDFDRKKAVHEFKANALKEKAKKAARANNDEEVVTLLSQAMDDPCEPTKRRYTIADATVEKVGELLIENPNGLLLTRDELVGWLKSLNRRDRESDRAFFLESWAGTATNYEVDRIVRGSLVIPALCISIHGNIQPGPLRHYVHEASTNGSGADGLLQRFQLMVWPDAGEWRHVDRWPDNDAKNRAFQVYETLAKASYQDWGAFRPKEDDGLPWVRFDPEAQELFDEFWVTLHTEKLRSESISPTLEAHLVKYRSLFPSLALIFHLVEVAAGTQPPGPISKHAALMAGAWCEYLETHARRVYASAENPDMEAARLLLAKLKQGVIELDSEGRFKPWVVVTKGWGGLKDTDAVKRAVDLLEAAGWVVKQDVKTKGRPAQFVEAHPDLRR